MIQNILNYINHLFLVKVIHTDVLYCYATRSLWLVEIGFWMREATTAQNKAQIRAISAAFCLIFQRVQLEQDYIALTYQLPYCHYSSTP